MKPLLRAIVVAGTAAGLIAGGHAALQGAPGQTQQPLTAAQLAQLNEKLAAQAAADQTTLQQLQTQEQTLESTVAQLQQEADAYRRQVAALEAQIGGTAPRAHTSTGASGVGGEREGVGE